MSVKIASPAHEVVYQDLCALVSKHAADVSAEEMLAIASNMVGKLIALQDQRVMTRERALETVMRNIEAGNQMILDQLGKSEGSVQ